jgi:hypothetical protein
MQIKLARSYTRAMAVEAHVVTATRWWPGGRRGAIALASVVLTVTAVGLWQVGSRGSELLCKGGMTSLCHPADVVGGKHAYVSANERVIERLPVYSGAPLFANRSSRAPFGTDPASTMYSWRESSGMDA